MQIARRARDVWTDYLYVAGRRLNCHFTIEILQEGRDDQLYNALIPRDRKIGNIDEMLAKLSNDLGRVVFLRNKQDPRIIHAIDKRLLKLDGYVLDKRTDLVYTGVIGDLSRKLKEEFPTIGPHTEGHFHERFDDHVTEVSITAKQESIRNILTNVVPLDNYEPRLWRAWTKIVDGVPFTKVQYYGPRRK